jgi:RNA polymerase sigma factor (sigma-70 family)
MYRGLRGNHSLAEEAGQEVMLRVLKYADMSASPANPARFLAYVRSVCSSVLADYFRRERRPGDHDGGGAVEYLPDQEPTPEEVEIRRDQLTHTLNELPEEERAAAKYLLFGFKAADMAQALGVDVGRVYRILDRLRRTLQRRLTLKEK